VGYTDNDGIEDANRNGVVDSGETGPCNPDTDGDILADGMEDRNGNGRVDAGESDPRRQMATLQTVLATLQLLTGNDPGSGYVWQNAPRPLSLSDAVAGRRRGDGGSS